MSYSLNGWVDGLVGADFEVDFEEGGGGGRRTDDESAACAEGHWTHLFHFQRHVVVL